MLNKLMMTFLSLFFMGVFSVAQAAIRTDAPLEMPRVEDVASEIKCLKAFVKADFAYAQPLCLSLARQGMRDAQLVTGLMYAFGEGVDKNPDMAALWLKEAVRNGSMEAKEVLSDIKLTD